MKAVIRDTEGIGTTKTAFIMDASPVDQYQYNGNWNGVEQLQHGTYVDSVNHFGRMVSRVGGVLELSAGYDKPEVVTTIQSIQYIHANDLTDEHGRELGYANIEAFRQTAKSVIGNIWYIRMATPKATKRITVNLEPKHDEIVQELMTRRGVKSKSQLLRELIEQAATSEDIEWSASGNAWGGSRR